MLLEGLNEIRQILNEEQGISDEVSVALFDIEKKLEKAIEPSRETVVDLYGTTLKNGTFTVNLFGEVLAVDWRFFSFKKEIYKELANIQTAQYAKKTEENKTPKITLRIPSVRGKYDTLKIYEALRHELQHFYDDVKYRFKSRFDYNLYKLSLDMMESDHKKYNYEIGLILYLSVKFEQQAYLNGTYEYLVRHENPLNVRENILETNLYRLKDELKQTLALLKRYTPDQIYQYPYSRNNLLILKQHHNLTISKIIKIGEETLQRLIRCIGRVLTKVEKDISDNYKIEKYI